MPSYGSSVSYHTALVTVAFLEAKLQHFVFLPHSVDSLFTKAGSDLQ